MKIIPLSAMALSLVGYAGVAAAQAPTPSPWSVMATGGPRYYLDGSRDAFSRQTVGFAGGFIAGRTVTSAELPIELAVELGFEAEAGEGTLHQAFTTRIGSLAPSLGLSLRWRARRWLLPYVRVQGGATWHSVSLEARDGTGAFDGGAWTFQASAGLGLMFQTGTFADTGAFRTTRFAFSIEGGAVYAMPAEISVETRAPSDERLARDRIAAPAVRLGALDTSATYVRLGVGLRF